MKIDIVKLENVRSHVKSTVPFTRGFNCLVGGMGCGKSSVLYAVDFAFFGDPVGRSFEYLLREGENEAKVTVQFAVNGNTYTLTRAIRRRGKSITQNLEELKLLQDEKLLASMNTGAVAEQLNAITGLNKDLWREIVWVRQEHLKELIDAQPRDRQKRIDELFGLSDYETAWSRIAEYQRDYEVEKRLLEKDPDITGKDKLSAEYDRITEEYTLTEVELENAQEKIYQTQHVMEETEKQLQQLEEKKLAIEELQRKEARLQADIKNAKDAAARLLQQAQTRQRMISSLHQRQGSMDSQMISCKGTLEKCGMPSNQPLEVLRGVLRDFDDRISGLRAEQEATSRSLQTDQKRLAQLKTETDNQCPLCLQPLNDEYKSSMVQRINEENAERQAVISQLQQEIREMQGAKRLADEAFSTLQTLVSRADELKSRIAEEEKSLAEVTEEQQAKKQLESELLVQLEEVRVKISGFDVSELEEARRKKDQAFRQYYAAESELKTKENHKKDLLRGMDDITARIDQAQQKIERLDKTKQTIQLIAAIRDAYRSIQPKLRSEFIKVLRNFVQQVLDSLVGGEAPLLNVVVDEKYTPYVKSESGADREVANLSGGERTLLAFAYRLGLGQLIMQSRTGQGLGMLLLDEPTENLGTEDGSIERLAQAISKFKAIEQIIAVTHSENFADQAQHVIILEKEANISKASIAKDQN
ncbi:MAG: SMC family ATPase [Candidatus Bathyarchaeota archaeon]|nr:SMC family ATPase [Candidatus Bathyarchaeota archaeon]